MYSTKMLKGDFYVEDFQRLYLGQKIPCNYRVCNMKTQAFYEATAKSYCMRSI